jgi:hypothetical protein
MRNNTKDANGKGFPLKITAAQVQVISSDNIAESEIQFVRHMLPVLDWPALVQASFEGDKKTTRILL